MSILNKINKKVRWLLIAIFVVVLRLLLPASFIEQYYARGLFQGIRWVFDHTTALLPFPTIYLLFVYLFYLFGNATYSLIKRKNISFKNIAWSFLNFVSIVVVSFLTLWGFNYGRQSIEAQLSFEPKPLTYEELNQELLLITKELNTARNAIPNVSATAITPNLKPNSTEIQVREELKSWLNQHHYPTNSDVRGRLLSPKGTLLRFSSAGVYLPWVGEGHIDAGMHPILIPFVLAHEISHGYGFGDEGTCNFIAYEALKNSKNPYFKYSALMEYWVYLASAVRAYKKEDYKTFYDNLPEGIKNDRKQIRAYHDRYPDIMPELRDAFYNQYLKTQGIKEGMKNYSRVIMLATAWRKAKATRGKSKDLTTSLKH